MDVPLDSEVADDSPAKDLIHVSQAPFTDSSNIGDSSDDSSKIPDNFFLVLRQLISLRHLYHLNK